MPQVGRAAECHACNHPASDLAFGVPIAFIAGASGFTGRAMLAELSRNPSGWRARPHARAAGRIDHPDVVVCDPLAREPLAAGMRGCDAVVQLIGTTRRRFAEGDYDQIDYGTTVALGEAARTAGVPRLLLLSSVGAGNPRGRYLEVKRRTEEWVERSGLAYTIVRPSFIVGPRRLGWKLAGALLFFSPTLRPIDVRDLARVFVRALEQPERVNGKILEGESLWAMLGPGSR
jgi:NADH dehydrogenase